MNARDGYKDDVKCGLGTDTAYADKLDRVNEDCENVVPGEPEPPTPAEEREFFSIADLARVIRKRLWLVILHQRLDTPVAPMHRTSPL